MLKKALALALVILVSAVAGCSSDNEKPAAPAASPSLTPEPNVFYDKGFFDLERDQNMSWRWMSEEGVIRLKNLKRDAVLKIKGNVPQDRFPQLPTITVKLNGEQLDQFPAPAAPTEKIYNIPASKQGTGEFSELRITSSKVFIPKELDKKSTDGRHLSFSLQGLTWEAK
ncbi:MAG TPA: hypothetical protein VFD58_27295 [Blastocatellia bacterium]|nr:hypothetical protein [Blastocatellia bacterium]